MSEERPNISHEKELDRRLCGLITGNHYYCPIYVNKSLAYMIKYICFLIVFLTMRAVMMNFIFIYSII